MTTDDEHPPSIAAALARIQDEERAQAAWEETGVVRDEAVRVAYEDLKATVAQNEIARMLKLNPSTFRSMLNRAYRRRGEETTSE